MKAIIALAAFLASSAAAAAEEKPVTLKDGPGRETVENTCNVCHSLDYIRINSPFMTPQTWQAEVNKMINIFGAPASPQDAKTIIDYLVKNYGKPS
jgi:sulfite dehydrogenase (cytochrome) subunit B